MADRFRPMVKAAILGAAGEAMEHWFLVDSGADRTAFSRETLNQLASSVLAGSESGVAGIGGVAGTVLVQARLLFWQDDGGAASVDGPWLAFLEAEADDEDILGRDVTNNFVTIHDYPNKRVLFVGGVHGYAITAPAS